VERGAGVIRMAEPQLGPAVEEGVLQVLRSGHLVQGPFVARLEALAAQMAGTTHAVAVSSGTIALEVALQLTSESGGEVITSPLTFPATLNAILRTGRTARFADVAPDLTVDPRSVAALVGPRTTTLLPVHLYGLTPDMVAVAALAHRHGLAIVEDAAQAHGAECAGRRAGSFGVGCFSLYATKNVAAGEGGLITTSDGELAQQARLVRNQGMDAERHVQVVGSNLRLTDLAAAIALPQLEQLAAITSRRETHAAALTALLGEVDGLRLPEPPRPRRSSWHQYTVVLPEGVDRDIVRKRMLAAGVETAAHYPVLVWDHPAFRDHPAVSRDDTPRARALVDRLLSIPVHTGLQPGDPGRIAGALSEALR
jgi:perosamine synthetase